MHPTQPAHPRQPHPMQPPQPVPGPPPAGPTHRGYGVLVLGGVLVWIGLVALLAISFGSALSSVLIALGEVKTPTDSGARNSSDLWAVGLATGVGALVLLLFSLILDVVMTVASICRLNGRRGDRAVPIIALTSVTVSLVLPVVLLLLAVLASFVDLTQVTALLLWLVVLVVLALSPLVRVVQAVAGLVRIITGEPAPPQAQLGPYRR